MTQLHPDETELRVVEKMLVDVEFPALFKLCVKPAFNQTELEAAGYESSWGYFRGRSRYNASIFGWAGHTKDGQIVSEVSGKQL